MKPILLAIFILCLTACVPKQVKGEWLRLCQENWYIYVDPQGTSWKITIPDAKWVKVTKEQSYKICTPHEKRRP